MLQKLNKVLLFIYIIHIFTPFSCRAFIANNGANGVPGTTVKIEFLNKNKALCTNNEGLKGICLPIRTCPEIRELLKSRGGIQSTGTADLLQERICFYRGREAYLCCLNNTEPARHPMLPTLDECGVSSGSRIFNGKTYSHGTQPWLVGLGYKTESKSLKIGCGGTLITRRHILTAAHCFARGRRDTLPQFTHVILGEHSLSEQTEVEPPIIRLIAERKNPGYENLLYYNDIELIILKEDVTFSRYINPACLPINDYVKHFDLKDIEMEIAGWGRTIYHNLTLSDTPQLATVPLLPRSKCQEVYKGIKGVMVDGTQICLGGNEKDTCQGDSGGPAVYHEEKMFRRYFLMGITAFGGQCGKKNFPGVYTYVPAYMEWIIENL